MAASSIEAQISITRLNDKQPIIYKSMPATEGNINGPSMLRIPDWIPLSSRPDSSAEYYLYFASHWGVHIKMAWSKDIEGPYTIYNPGLGVFHLDNYISPGKLVLHQHIASPDVHVDHVNQQFIMYFHVGDAIWNGDTLDKQKTVVATSADGLDFNEGLKNVIVCPFYARVFEHDNNLYALHKEGFSRAHDLSNPWEHNEDFSKSNPYLWKRVSDPFSAVQNEVRHTAILKSDSYLHLMYSRYPASPEHLEYSRVKLNPIETFWRATQPIDVLYPEFEWEGVNYPIEASESGWKTKVHELRDPYLFQDKDGQIYLLYCGAGENAIGLARVDELPSTDDNIDAYDIFCSSISIYPNPISGDYITISGIKRESHIEIFSPEGQKIMEQLVSPGGDFQFDVTGLQNGIFLLSIQDGEHFCARRIVLQRDSLGL